MPPGANVLPLMIRNRDAGGEVWRDSWMRLCEGGQELIAIPYLGKSPLSSFAALIPAGKVSAEIAGVLRSEG